MLGGASRKSPHGETPVDVPDSAKRGPSVRELSLSLLAGGVDPRQNLDIQMIYHCSLSIYNGTGAHSRFEMTSPEQFPCVDPRDNDGLTCCVASA